MQPSLGLKMLDSTINNIMQPFTMYKLVAAVPFNWGVFLKVGGFHGLACRKCMVFLQRWETLTVNCHGQAKTRKPSAAKPG